MESYPSPYDRQRCSQSHVPQAMSSSLRERLKKCGRYHPATPPPLSKDTSLAKPNIITNQNPCTGERVTHLNPPLSECDSSTPKRKPPKVLREAKCNNGSQFIKRQKVDVLKTKINADADIGNVTHQPSYGSEVTLHDRQSTSSNEAPNTNILTPSVNQVLTDHALVKKSGAACLSSSRMDDDNSNPCKIQDLIMQREQLEAELKAKEEQLRKLKMVKMYREKNDLTELQGLINKWRDVCQRALVSLVDLHPPPKPTMNALIEHLQFDPQLISYNAEEESFC